MGICTSSQSNESQPTANLILMDGSIRQFSEALKCGEILQEFAGHFICSSDGLFIGRKISDVLEEDEQLQIGQLYFLLPSKKLEYLVTESDMGNLLYKASCALKHKRSSRSQKVQPLFDIHLDLKEEKQEFSWAEEDNFLMSSKASVSAASSKSRMGKNKNQWHLQLETIMEGV